MNSTTSQPSERKVAAGAKPIIQAQQVHSTQPRQQSSLNRIARVSYWMCCCLPLMSRNVILGWCASRTWEVDLSARVRVDVQGVPAEGIIDSEADITIMGGELFRQVAAVAKLRKHDLMNPDKIPRNYDQCPFKLDGKMKLDITFDGN